MKSLWVEGGNFDVSPKQPLTICRSGTGYVCELDINLLENLLAKDWVQSVALFVLLVVPFPPATLDD